MINPNEWSEDALRSLQETDELEMKLAAGRDGRGELPKDFWPTYSAFANTSGGYVVLGVREKSGRFEIGGIHEPDKVIRQIFDQVCNRQKVSSNLISTDDVEVCQIGVKHIISVRIRPGSRREKPVFIDGNPLTGTYKRVHEGDRICLPDVVKRMLAEQTEDSRDDRVLKGFSLSDLSSESVEVYRRMLRDASPLHPFLDQPLSDFLRSIRAWRIDRDTGVEGLTVAGLLMFGTSENIRDEFPNYAVDYQERDEPRVSRWVDRLTNDGTWSGNLFDFYRLVWRKLTAGIKVPFQLVGAQRHDETSVHLAIREALVNTLVHSDFTGRASVLVVRRPDMFGFRNPGGMRIPIELAIRGGESDGRNRTLQQMFLLIGAGERAGSGVPKIHKGWREQHWRPPALYEVETPSEQTLLELHMEDLLPAGVVDSLRKRFGDRFDDLMPDERVLLATAAIENTVSHARAMTLCEMHPVDMTRLLQGLVQHGFLEKIGQGRGTRYFLHGTQLVDPDEAFLSGQLPLSSTSIFEPSDPDSEGSGVSSEGSEANNGEQELGRGRAIQGLELPLIDTLGDLQQEFLSSLKDIASKAAGRRVAKETMESVIVGLCAENFITLKILAGILGRSEDYLRQEYLNRLVKEGQLRLAFPQSPNHPRQAYSSAI
ncbi:MAG: RNA-binding domain-containing protein [Sphingobium sp.]